MDFIKRNTAFFVCCTSLLLIFLVLAALTFVELRKFSSTKSKIANADDQIQTLMSAKPTPNGKNMQAAKENRDELKERLSQIYKELQNGANIKVSSEDEGAIVISSILKYISDYGRRLDNHVNASSKSAPIKVSAQFPFGFEDYFGSTPIPEGSIVPLLDKQRHILSYILDQLIDSDPISILDVKRENLEEIEKGFQIDPAISARVPNSVNTLAFQVVFTGYTPTLRRFLNNLAYFHLPIVVRSVQVNRLDSKFQAEEKPSKKNVDSDDNDIMTPIISEIESKFTVTLEFVEVVKLTGFEENKPSEIR